MARNTGLNREAGGEIKTGEVERGTNNEIRNLSYCLSTDEGKPMVGFGLEEISHFSHQAQGWDLNSNKTNLLFTRLKDITIGQEKGLHLIDTAWGNENKIEDGEESQLEGESSISNLPEGETTEKSGENMEDDLVPHIILERGSA